MHEKWREEKTRKEESIGKWNRVGKSIEEKWWEKYSKVITETKPPVNNKNQYDQN